VSAPDVSERRPFAYALLRVMPHVERGERLNVGVVLFCRQHDFLELRFRVDERRVSVLAPELDAGDLRARLDALARVAAGDSAAGALAQMDMSDRFGWLTAPSSTVIQPSEVHTGITDDPTTTLARLFETLVA
jgi:Protein of unknown function (DUF3037)